MTPAPLPWLLLLACLAGSAGVAAAQSGPAERPGSVEASPADLERVARYSVENARALRREGRLEMAEASARRGLGFTPGDPALQRELARILEAQGRGEEANRARSAADAVDPPPPSLPEGPLALPSRGVLVVLLAPAQEVDPQRRPLGWPDGAVAETLEGRLRQRLPEATVVHAELETVGAARAWLPQYSPRTVLSLRVDRVYCGDSVKDGHFGLAWLRVAAERPGSSSQGPAWGRSLVDEPRLAMGCEREVSARALERVLALPQVREALAATSEADGPWPTASIRALFPGIDARIDAELAEGSELLTHGRVADAAEAFERAAAIDPDDPVVRSYRREAEATLAMSRELSRRLGSADADDLDPRLSPAQRAALEAQLVAEQRRRQELLTALAVMSDDVRLPAGNHLKRLRPVSISDPEAFGPALARRRAGGEVEARAADAPDGSELARYYFPAGEALPVLREEDINRDGKSDRWIAYAGETRSEIWEDGRDVGRPDVKLVFRDGHRLLRVEVDRDGNDRPERVFHYSRGALSAEAQDTDGDGRLDTFDRLDEQGNVGVREEDLDGDGEIDVRSVYQAGVLLGRELSGPATPE